MMCFYINPDYLSRCFKWEQKEKRMENIIKGWKDT